MRNVLTVLLFICASVGFAQGKSAEEKASALTAKMQAEIGFNDQTKEKVQAINLDFTNKASQLRASESDRAKKFKALKQLDQDRADALKKIFTEKEYAAFEKFREENKQQMRQRIKENRDN